VTRHALRLLVVDDHPAVRLGIRQVLENEPDIDVVDVCVTGESAVSRAEFGEIDVAVVDFHLGGRNGLWVTRKMKQLSRPPRVVIFSAFASDHLAANCVAAGADALLSKGSLGSDLCDAVRAVARGRRVFPRVPPALAGALGRRLEETDRQIFAMLLAGISHDTIERALDISRPERESRQAAIVRALEPLPGERWAHAAANDGASGDRLEFEN
jgi:DNA-binding NarL/FixJ family response regulator